MRHLWVPYGWLWAWACMLGTATAGEEDHRLAVQRALWASRSEMHSGPWLFFSDVYVQKENGSFTQSSGHTFMSVPARTYSHYDPSVAHSMEAFYASAQFRYRWVLNYVSPASHWLLSMGYDNGVQTPKLGISPAVFWAWLKRLTCTKTITFNFHGDSGLAAKSHSVPAWMCMTERIGVPNSRRGLIALGWRYLHSNTTNLNTNGRLIEGVCRSKPLHSQRPCLCLARPCSIPPRIEG